MRFLFTFFFIFILTNVLFAEKYYVLYGFKIGQNISTVKKQFGEPFKAQKFDDGFSYIAYEMKDHYLIIESDNTKPDLIWAIQIQGKNNPKNLGLQGLNLGDKEENILKIFGKPDEKREAYDEETKKPLKGVDYYSFYHKSNFSIEVTNNKVSSIKILYNGINETKDLINKKEFLKNFKNNNYYQICNSIAYDFFLMKEKKIEIETSLLDSLLNNKEINEIFFNKNFGIVSLEEKELVQSALRLQIEPKVAGLVFKVDKNNKKYELFFTKGFEGWILKYIYFVE